MRDFKNYEKSLKKLEQLNKNNRTSASVVSLEDLLFLVFLVLKLTNIINWSWAWIIAPIWIPLVLEIISNIILCIDKIKLEKLKKKEEEKDND